MIKLASLALVPVLAATFYAHQDAPTAADRAEWADTEKQDQQFLDELSQQAPSNSSDRQFLAQLQAAEIPAARPPVEVRRAIAVVHEPVAAAPTMVASVPSVSTSETAEMPEVRRAIPVSVPVAPVATAPAGDLRKSLRQSYVTMVEPDPSEPAPKRASIMIYGDQVVIHSRGMLQRDSSGVQ